jgi:hypothetical protein
MATSDVTSITSELHYSGIVNKLFLHDDACWYRIKAGAIIEIEPVNDNGETIKSKAKLFKTLNDMNLQLGSGQKIGIEEVK